MSTLKFNKRTEVKANGMFNDFLKTANENGMDINNFYTEHEDGYSVVAFRDFIGDDQCVFNIAFFDYNNTIRYSVSKQIENINNDQNKLFDMLVEINAVNIEYDDLSFVLDDGTLEVKKTFQNLTKDVDLLNEQFAEVFNAAIKHFPNIG